MKCKKCEEEKEESFFYKNDRTCKECRKEMVRKNRLDNVEYYRAYDRERFQSDPKVRERNARYQKTEAGKSSTEKSRKKWAANNREAMKAKLIEYRSEFPKKYAAHSAVHCAKIKGVLVPGECEVCGSSNQTHAHHDDYDKPLDVRWLCPQHHRDWHKEHGEALNPR